MSVRLLGLCVMLLGLLLCACTQSSTKAANWPTGTVLAVDGIAIQAAEVDAKIDTLLDIKPAFSVTHRRRLIVLHWSFPMAYGMAHAGPARAAALQRAEDWMKARATSPPEPLTPAEEDVVGNWDILGIDTWLMSRELQPGESTGIIELPGRYAVIRMVQRDNNTNLARELFALRIESFEYVDDPLALVEDCMQATLEIVDPAWREVIPGIYKYKMQAEQNDE